MSKPIDYKKIAQAIVKKETENLNKTIAKGQCPDLSWKLEEAIVDALIYVAKVTTENMKEQVKAIIDDFDSNDGTSNN